VNGLPPPIKPIKPSTLRRLPRSFYDRETTTVARELLGKILVHHAHGVIRKGRIVEVEAYLGEKDLAAHSSRGVTPRTKIMFGPPGHAYIYLVYGMHNCMNVVTEGVGTGTAVLLRALEPLENLESKTNGPGLLCKAMGIDLRRNGTDLFGHELFIAHAPRIDPSAIVRTRRIGVEYARHWARRLLRFYIRDNGYVSRK
jgi:DNA-3-methyladenine glycosylase